MDLMMERVSHIAAGYKNADYYDDLRTDPIIKMCAGRSTETEDDLDSQPTMSRFENSITRTYLSRLAQVFVDNFIASYDNEPNIIEFDFDLLMKLI